MIQRRLGCGFYATAFVCCFAPMMVVGLLLLFVMGALLGRAVVPPYALMWRIGVSPVTVIGVASCTYAVLAALWIARFGRGPGWRRWAGIALLLAAGLVLSAEIGGLAVGIVMAHWDVTVHSLIWGPVAGIAYLPAFLQDCKPLVLAYFAIGFPLTHYVARHLTALVARRER